MRLNWFVFDSVLSTGSWQWWYSIISSSSSSGCIIPIRNDGVHVVGVVVGIQVAMVGVYKKLLWMSD